MIEVINLCKDYGSQLAVDNVSFTLEDKKVYGFLGPNGAGKSTTMNIVTGCLAATSGQVLIGGHDIYEDPINAKKLIGYLPEIPPLYLDMTVSEYLYFIAEVKGVKKDVRDEQLEEIMKETKTYEVRGRLIKHLSKGYKQRVGIAQALIGEPEVVILDEPTEGLDPKQRVEIRQLIRNLGKNHTVILSSHILAEIRNVCDHIIMISNGKVVANDTLAKLEESYGMDLEKIFLKLTTSTYEEEVIEEEVE